MPFKKGHDPNRNTSGRPRTGASKKEELFLDVVHGILHLLGHDDSTNKNREKMKKRQEQILKKIINKL